jgi:hypothetical protein
VSKNDEQREKLKLAFEIKQLNNYGRRFAATFEALSERDQKRCLRAERLFKSYMPPVPVARFILAAWDLVDDMLHRAS